MTMAFTRIPQFALCCALYLLVLLPSAAFATSTAQPPPTGKRATDSAFVHASGNRLLLHGSPLVLRAIGFSNYYELELEPRQLLRSNHHGPEDFQRVAELGMNAVRFAFRGVWYERDPHAFFSWLDRNIAWARQAGIYLILDLHVPIGGFWLDPSGGKSDFSLWSEPALQQRNLALWRAIAARYRDEPVIAAYDVLNEPVTSDSDGAQWRRFAQQLVDEIRRVDPNHLLIIGKLYGVRRTYTTEGEESQFLVADDNVMYDFHFYDPIDYTHQYASWIARPMGDGGRYPDAQRFLPTGGQRYITSLTQQRPLSLRLPSRWQRFTSSRMRIDDPRITMAVPSFIAGELGGTTVYLDHLTVSEYDTAGQLLRTVIDEPLSRESVWHWWGWHSPTQGRSATFTRIEHDGVNDRYSLAIADTEGVAGLSGWSSDQWWFPVKQGHSYSISAYLRADGLSETAADKPLLAYFDLAFYGESQPGAGFVARDRHYLEAQFLKLYRFGKEHNVPMSVMEFGLMRSCFEMTDKGGTQWVSDMLDIFGRYQVSFSYWHYHGDRMGLYLDASGEMPATLNQPLYETLRSKLHGR